MGGGEDSASKLSEKARVKKSVCKIKHGNFYISHYTALYMTRNQQT